MNLSDSGQIFSWTAKNTVACAYTAFWSINKRAVGKLSSKMLLIEKHKFLFARFNLNIGSPAKFRV